MNHRFKSVPHGIYLGFRGFIFALAIGVVKALLNKAHSSYIDRMLKSGYVFILRKKNEHQGST